MGRALSTIETSNPIRVAVIFTSTPDATFGYVAVSPSNVGAGRFDSHFRPAFCPFPASVANTAPPPPENVTASGTAFGCTPVASDTKVVSTPTHDPSLRRVRIGWDAEFNVHDPSGLANVVFVSVRSLVTSTG
jgi:hypothetical protein